MSEHDAGAISSPALNQAAPEPSALVRLFRSILRYYPLWLIFALWELVTRAGLVDTMLMPPLTHVLRSLYDGLFVTGELMTHIGYSFARASIGLGLATVVGITLGILMGRSRVVESFVDPLISAIFPTPKLAIFPLMMVLLGIGDLSKIALIFLGCFFPIVINTYAGVRNVDKYFIWNALTKGASRRQVLWTVILPASLPFIFAGLRVATSTAFLLIVASELIASNEGLGFIILYAQRSFNPDLMFSGVLLVAGMGFTADRLLLALGRWLFSWQERSEV